MIRPSDRNPIFDLHPSQNNFITPEAERDGLHLLEEMNRRHQRHRRLFWVYSVGLGAVIFLAGAIPLVLAAIERN